MIDVRSISRLQKLKSTIHHSSLYKFIGKIRMCGIFCYSFKHGRLSAARRAVLATNLARYNDDRGGDSWGVVGINADGSHVSRGLGDLSDHAYELCEFQTLFAHTRFASSGEVNMRNAHPFKVGKILGAHNGAVYNHAELCAQLKRNFPVDSIHLFAHLNENRPFYELVARGAIEWIKLEDPKTVYLSKLFAGELAVYGIGDQHDPDGIVWSSNYKHLLKALFCTGIHEHHRFEVRRGRVYFVNNGTFGVVKDMKLHVTEPIFNKPDEPVVISGEQPKTDEEAPSSDEAGAARFRAQAVGMAEVKDSNGEWHVSDEKRDTSIVSIHSHVDGVTLWRGIYGNRTDI
jgi:hypothetical protein